MGSKKQINPASRTSLMAVGKQIHQNSIELAKELPPDARRPISLGGKIIDAAEVEALGRNGLDEFLALRLLKIPVSVMEEEPEAAQEFRQALEYGLALLSNEVQTVTISKALDEGDPTMLKLVAGAYGAKPLQTNKNAATGTSSDAQGILNGMLKFMLEQRQTELDQQRRMIAEEKARMDAKTVSGRPKQPPILGEVDYRRSIPECESVIAADGENLPQD